MQLLKVKDLIAILEKTNQDAIVVVPEYVPSDVTVITPPSEYGIAVIDKNGLLEKKSKVVKLVQEDADTSQALLDERSKVPVFYLI